MPVAMLLPRPGRGREPQRLPVRTRVGRQSRSKWFSTPWRVAGLPAPEARGYRHLEPVGLRR